MDRCAPRIEPEFSGNLSPKKLSRSELTPISVYTAMRFKTSDGTPPPPLQEFEIDEDRHAALNLKDVPVCSPGIIEELPIQQRCEAATIGGGRMILNIHFPEQPPIETQSALTAFNGGLKGGVRTLLVAGNLKVPTPAAIVITILVKESKPSAYKLKLAGSIPKIAGGNGSITFLGLRFRKGIFSARCQNGHLVTGFGAKFADGSFFRGGLLRPCTSLP
ncbi:MAG TPA: hypothetical protein VFP21_05110 [Solirubrobacterales bacterium]|nr:hypothetical protein [Solirubrobacterales bacterium]